MACRIESWQGLPESGVVHTTCLLVDRVSFVIDPLLSCLLFTGQLQCQAQKRQRLPTSVRENG